jgi:hypothetical protein
MAVLWNLLGRFNATSQQLQSKHMHISLVYELYGSLIEMVRNTRNSFDEFERKAKLMSGIEDYSYDLKRKKRRKVQFDECGEAGDAPLSGQAHFRVNTFNVILDKLLCELERRSGAYLVILERYQVIVYPYFISHINMLKKHALINRQNNCFLLYICR